MKNITISGVIGWDSTAAGLREALNEAAGSDVEITISSPGGFISDGLEMFNLVRNYPGQTTARLSGYAMSMASYIPLAADRIVAEDNAIYMIHNVRGGVFGDHNKILNYGATTKGMSRLIAKAYSKRTGKSLAEIEKMMDVETYLFGDEMVGHGFVDEIISTGSEKDPETARAMACFAQQECSMRMSADISAVKRDLASVAVMIGAMNAIPKKEREKEQIMNLKMLKSEHPDLVEALRAEFAEGRRAAMEGPGGPMCGTCACQSCQCADGDCATCSTKPGASALATARIEGATAERDRIAAVRACLIPGHEALVETLAADGQSSAADAALAIVAAEKQLRISAAADLMSEASPLVPPTDSESSEQSRSMKRTEFNKLSLTEQSAVVKAGTRIVE